MKEFLMVLLIAIAVIVFVIIPICVYLGDKASGWNNDPDSNERRADYDESMF